jgi:hypothetical protein
VADLSDGSKKAFESFLAVMEAAIEGEEKVGAAPVGLPDHIRGRLLALAQKGPEGRSPDQRSNDEMYRDPGRLFEMSVAIEAAGEGHPDLGVSADEAGEYLRDIAVELAFWRFSAQHWNSEAKDWREEAWRCFCASGADPDGADARHLNPGEAVAAVEEGRKQGEEDYDDIERRLEATADVVTKIRAEIEEAVLECSEGTAEGAAKAQKRLEALLK